MSLRRPDSSLDAQFAANAEEVRGELNALNQGPLSFSLESVTSRGGYFAESSITQTTGAGTHVNVLTIGSVNLLAGRMFRISGCVTLSNPSVTARSPLLSVAWASPDIFVPTDILFSHYARLDGLAANTPVTVEFSRHVVGTGRVAPLSLFSPVNVAAFSGVVHQLRVEDIAPI